MSVKFVCVYVSVCGGRGVGGGGGGRHDHMSE